jgi:hypothetical protein
MAITNEQNVNDTPAAKGEVVIESYESTWWSSLLPKKWAMHLQSAIGKIKHRQKESNLVVQNSNAGVNLLVDAIRDGKSIQIDEGQIGKDNTSPTDSDTGLGNAIVTGESVQSTDGTVNTVTFSFFITDEQLPDDTYEEFGLFTNGNLFARSLFDSSYTKGGNTDTRVNHKITFNN